GPDMPNARRDALKAAVAQARLDAESMAEAAGGSLGRLVVLSTGMAQESYAVQDMGVQLTGLREQVGVPTAIRPTDLAVIAVAIGRWEFVPQR
ncbi:MAG: SIMPL domain-containing protein, partial [Gemmatimonadales bacterium]